MAHLWLEGAAGWEAARLPAEPVEISAFAGPEIGAESVRQDSTGKSSALLAPAAAAGARTWVLFAALGSGIRVNGEAPSAGLRVLDDRDEIRTKDGRQMRFSTETLAQIEPFPPSERPIYCGRCRQPIETGAPAVRCPGCGVWYNQAPELPCWTYSEKCAFCDQATALDAGFQWTPEE
jgi:hypothetical protein